MITNCGITSEDNTNYDYALFLYFENITAAPSFTGHLLLSYPFIVND
jgi:hypothetical protein